MKPLIIIIGRTASGKDTLADQLKKHGLIMAISHTTRPRRDGEGETHIFIDSIEPYPHRWVETEINGHHYFILEEDVHNNDVLVIDPIGLDSLLEQPEFNRPYKILYIDIPYEIRKHRYMKRGNATEAQFIQRDASEDGQFSEYEHRLQDPIYRKTHDVSVLTNDDEIQAIITEIASL